MSLPAVKTPPRPAMTTAPMSGSRSAVVERLDQRLVHGAGDGVLLLRAGEGGEENRPLARNLDPGAHIASARTDS